MSKEGSPELTKSWVFVDSGKKSGEDDKDGKETSGVQEVTENEPHLDSDTDSISVISESGCSYRTDEEEFTPTTVPEEEDVKTETEEKEPEFVEKESEVVENEPDIVEEEPKAVENEQNIVEPQPPEPKKVEKLLYFATSAFCAVILIGLSVAVQQYLQGASDVNTFDPDQEFIFPRVQNVLSESPQRKFSLKRKNQFRSEEVENKIAKLEEDNEIHDKIISTIGDNDPSTEGNVKSNYKLNKNKISKCNKENCDAKNFKHEKIRRDETAANDKKTTEQISDENGPDGKICDKKVKELKVREDYLREKEKFLIEKEHDLMKKEIKLKKDKENYGKNKHDKPYFNKKEKEFKRDSSEEDSGEKKGRFKPSKENFNSKNKKYKHKEDASRYSTQKKYRFSEGDRKRNITGHWYMNLHEARDNMRQKKRASFKRNKAHWYFQWMVDRARLRVK